VCCEGQTSEERKIERAEKEKTLIRKVCCTASYDVVLTAMLIVLMLERILWLCLGPVLTGIQWDASPVEGLMYGYSALDSFLCMYVFSV